MTIKVLFVMGCGRSGSTLLDMLMGSQVGGFSAGELCGLGRALNSRSEYCACGLPSVECDFWTRVRTDWAARVNAIEDGTDTTYDQLRSKFERLRFLPRLLLASSARQHRDFQQYQRRTVALFKSIQANSGCDYIVDSSKSPGRAFMLTLMDDLDVYVIHLVRDCRGVIYSYQKPYRSNPRRGIGNAIPGKPILRTLATWLSVNWIANRIRARLGKRSCLLTYEYLLQYPHEVLSYIGNACGLHVLGGPQSNAGLKLSGGHMIAGNRLRLKDEVRMRRPDESWRTGLAPWKKVALGWLASSFVRVQDSQSFRSCKRR